MYCVFLLIHQAYLASVIIALHFRTVCSVIISPIYIMHIPRPTFSASNTSKTILLCLQRSCTQLLRKPFHCIQSVIQKTLLNRGI